MERFSKLKVVEKASDTTSKDVVEIYDEWDEYEKFYCLENGKRKPDPGLVATELAVCLDDKYDSRILDVASGTGLVGLELADRGFKNVDGLDGSKNMLKRSQEKGIYRNTFCSLFSDQPTDGLQNETYDALISTASFGGKHLPAVSLVEFLRLTKPGGFIVIGILEGFMLTDEDTATFEPTLQGLCDAGQCQLVLKKVCPVFDFKRRRGFVFVIKKL